MTQKLKSKYDLSAVHGLNRYLWSKLSAPGGVINPARYADGLIPIIPTQQIPALNNMVDQLNAPGGVPFIVYHWTTPAIGENFYTELDHIIYMIYSAEESEIRSIMNLIKDEFSRWDIAAQDVNAFIQTDPSTSSDSRYTTFDYKAISVVNMNAGLPTNTEGGRSEGTVSIRVSYGFNTDNSLRRA